MRAKRAAARQKSILPMFANMDVVMNQKPLISGRYKLIPLDENMFAKMDVVIVQINEITNR
jgi:hypothetical protein